MKHRARLDWPQILVALLAVLVLVAAVWLALVVLVWLLSAVSEALT